MSNEEIRAIDCMAQHIKIFLKQADHNEPANFAEPCEKCPYIKECNLCWTDIMYPLTKKTNIENPCMLIKEY